MPKLIIGIIYFAISCNFLIHVVDEHGAFGVRVKFPNRAIPHSLQVVVYTIWLVRHGFGLIQYSRKCHKLVS